MSEDQNSWVLDSLVGFLKGPVWTLAIQAFIEQKSVVFDAEEQSDDVTQEYRALFEEYKSLVDRLLSSHMSDLEISAEQFDDACRRADGVLAEKFKQSLFEQIWAANDFRTFTRFMAQRNVELQLQALEMLSHRFGLVFDSFKEEVSEDLLAEEAGREDETEVLKQRLESEIIEEQRKLSNAIQRALHEELQEEDQTEPEVEEELKQEVKQEVKEEPKAEPKAEPKEEPKVQELSAEEIRKRGEYLRRQRDKLLAIKKKERNKQMARLEQQELLAQRPKSARAIRSVQDNSLEASDGDQSLAFRRSLAARLKAEVIEKQKQ